MANNDPTFICPVDDCPWRSPREILASHGYEPIAPEELSDRQLPGRLWELLYAAAGRRFFFHNTDHLSDRELYVMLWKYWLDEPTADIPLEAETNTQLPLSEFAHKGLTAEEVWLRYYADEEMRSMMLAGQEVLPHEEPEFDRDRFLPLPPIPLEMHSGPLPGDEDPVPDEDPDEDDPLGLAKVDREIAAAKSDESFSESAKFQDPDPEFQALLESMEPDSWVPPAKRLADENIPLLPPDEITDETLVPILWELLHNLSLRGYYVLHTDHLSDRELYSEIWDRGLRDPAMLPGRNPRGGWFHDILGSWGEEQMQLWLRYYATDEERAKHISDWPKDVLPPKETPVAKRDWRLPKGPFH